MFTNCHQTLWLAKGGFENLSRCLVLHSYRLSRFEGSYGKVFSVDANISILLVRPSHNMLRQLHVLAHELQKSDLAQSKSLVVCMKLIEQLPHDGHTNVPRLILLLLHCKVGLLMSFLVGILLRF